MVELRANTTLGDTTLLSKAILEKPAEIKRELAVAFNRLGGEFQRRVTTQRFVGYTGSRNSGDRLQTRSGTGKSRTAFRTTSENGLPRTDLYTDWRWGELQERGKPGFRASSGKLMRVPQEIAMTASGVKRPEYDIVPDGTSESGRARYKTKAGDRTFIYEAKGGKLFIAIQPSKRSRMKLLYQLVAQVAIPPRFGFLKTWEEMADVVQQEVDAAAERALA